MGVLFDYFRAPDASTAAAVLERFAGPRDPDAPPMDAVFGKGFEPAVMMVRLHSLLTGIPYDQLPTVELVAMEGEDGPWIMQLSEELRDALADAQPSRLPAVAEQWVRTEEFWDQPPAAEVLPFLGEITALARRARQAAERLYCWSACSGLHRRTTSRLTPGPGWRGERSWIEWVAAAFGGRCCARKGPPSRENAAW